MVEFIEIMIENLEKSILQIVPSRIRKRNKKESKKKKAVTFDDSDKKHNGKKFCKYRGKWGHTPDEYTTLKALIRRVKQEKANIFVKGEKVHWVWSIYNGWKESQIIAKEEKREVWWRITCI